MIPSVIRPTVADNRRDQEDWVIRIRGYRLALRIDRVRGVLATVNASLSSILFLT